MGDFFPFGEDEEEDADLTEPLAFDDDLPILERLQKYFQSDLMLHRLYLVRQLGEFAVQLGWDATNQHLLHLLNNFSDSTDPGLRQALVEQIPELAAFFANVGSEDAYNTGLILTLLPIIARSTTDTNQQVRGAASEALLQVAGVLRPVDLSAHLLPILKSLANDATEEDHRVEAALLLGSIATIMGPDQCMESVMPLFTHLADDQCFRVRKAIAGQLGTVCVTVGSVHAAGYVLPIFLKLSGDEIWGVRKGCAESLVGVANVVPLPLRAAKLIPVFEAFMEDKSRWVRGSAMQSMGPFIALFESDLVSPRLVAYFVSMASNADPEVVATCAYNFPAVLVTIGGERWPELSVAYVRMARDPQWKVRQTLAYSLHEVSRIVGTAIAEESLMPVLDLFLKDMEEVTLAVLGHVSDFLAVLSPPKRAQYLPALLELLQKNEKVWRFRKYIAKQLSQMSMIFDGELLEHTVMPLALDLCHDHVAKVRVASCAGVATLLLRLSQEQLHPLNELIASLLEMAHSSSFQYRQTFVQIAEQAALRATPQNSASFDSQILPALLALSGDRVPNVRFALARSLMKIIASEHYLGHSGVLASVEALRGDVDRDVVYYATPRQPVSEINEHDADTGFREGNLDARATDEPVAHHLPPSTPDGSTQPMDANGTVSEPAVPVVQAVPPAAAPLEVTLAAVEVAPATVQGFEPVGLMDVSLTDAPPLGPSSIPRSPARELLDQMDSDADGVISSIIEDVVATHLAGEAVRELKTRDAWSEPAAPSAAANTPASSAYDTDAPMTPVCDGSDQTSESCADAASEPVFTTEPAFASEPILPVSEQREGDS
eukprot:TRINITY_DN4602_c0_g1_i2.p1 TRINITY_DN4602_c0_g1~~TRINITY_DN4602_c0_g1_i2.p1  ORF type:complete len:832 (-),score=188.10 TRINITY_DN4602_c0_g1_i2:411-2906(-)